MALSTPIPCYYNACGTLFHKSYPSIYGREFKVCLMECIAEMRWRQTLSTMGEEYRPQK